jgi:hypothetical protein
MKKIENKSIAKNLNKAKSVVDFFELNNNVITCYCYSPENETEENYTPIDVTLNEFELWLDDEGFLKGDYERIVCPHEMITTIDTWSYTIDEFMSGENHHWNISDLLTKFLNKN